MNKIAALINQNPWIEIPSAPDPGFLVETLRLTGEVFQGSSNDWPNRIAPGSTHWRYKLVRVENPDTISPKATKVMEESLDSLEKGKAGNPVDLSGFEASCIDYKIRMEIPNDIQLFYKTVDGLMKSSQWSVLDSLMSENLSTHHKLALLIFTEKGKGKFLNREKLIEELKSSHGNDVVSGL